MTPGIHIITVQIVRGRIQSWSQLLLARAMFFRLIVRFIGCPTPGILSNKRPRSIIFTAIVVHARLFFDPSLPCIIIRDRTTIRISTHLHWTVVIDWMSLPLWRIRYGTKLPFVLEIEATHR